MKLSKKIMTAVILVLAIFSLTGIPVDNQSTLGVPKVEAADKDPVINVKLVSMIKETSGLKYRWRYVYDTGYSCVVTYSSWKWFWQ